MAMTVRLPADLDARLEKLAAERHTSKHALLLEGAQRVVEQGARREQISAAVDFVTTHDAELLQRLEDA